MWKNALLLFLSGRIHNLLLTSWKLSLFSFSLVFLFFSSRTFLSAVILTVHSILHPIRFSLPNSNNYKSDCFSDHCGNSLWTILTQGVMTKLHCSR